MSKTAPILRIEVDRRYVANLRPPTATNSGHGYQYRVKVFRQGQEEPRTYRPSVIQRALIDNHWSERTDSGPNRVTRMYYAGNAKAKKLTRPQVELLIQCKMDGTIESHNYYSPTARKLADLGYIKLNQGARIWEAIAITDKGRAALVAWCNRTQGTTTRYPEALKIVPTDVTRLMERIYHLGRGLDDWHSGSSIPFNGWEPSSIRTGVETNALQIFQDGNGQLLLGLTDEGRQFVGDRLQSAEVAEQKREAFELEWRLKLAPQLSREGCTLKADRADVLCLHLSWPSGIWVDTFYHDGHVTEYGIGTEGKQDQDSAEARQLAADLQYAAIALDILNKAAREAQQEQKS